VLKEEISTKLFFTYAWLHSLGAINAFTMKKVFVILTAAVMLGTVSFAQQSQTPKDTTTHKASTTKSKTSSTKKSGNSTTHSTSHTSKADSTTKSSTKKP